MCHHARRHHQSRGLLALCSRRHQGDRRPRGKSLARGGRSEALEGKARARNVVLEFESYEAARRYFHSEQYQAARKLREGAAEMEMVLVEGV